MKTIKMINFITPNIKILFGEKSGSKVRKCMGLDKLDLKESIVNIEIPKDSIWNITHTFFRGLFEPSIIKYKDKFSTHYLFTHENMEELEDSLSEKIKYNIDYTIERM